MRKVESFLGLLAFQTKSSKTLSSNGDSAVHPLGRTSRFTFLKRLVLLKGEATDFFRLSRSIFRKVLAINFMLNCVAPPDDTLRWYFCGCSTEEIYFLSRLLVADSGQSARPVSWLEFFRKMHVVGTTL